MPHRYLLDANLSPSLVTALSRSLGLDIRSILESHPHDTNDAVIMRVASEEERIVITRDRDFLSLFASMRRLKVSVIYLALSNETLKRRELRQRLERFLEYDAPGITFESVLVTVTDHEIQIDGGWRVMS